MKTKQSSCPVCILFIICIYIYKYIYTYVSVCVYTHPHTSSRREEPVFPHMETYVFLPVLYPVQYKL